MDSITKGKPLLLTAAVSGGQATIDTAYEIAKMANFFDFINLMAYDVINNRYFKCC